VIGTVALVAAMLSKPTAMVVPLIALCLDVLVLRRPVREAFVALVPWFLLVIPCMLWTRAAQGVAGVPVAPVWARPIIALDSLTFYIGKLIAPTGLAVIYGRTPVRVMESRWFWFSWILPLVLFIVLMLNRKRFPELLAAGALLTVGVLPVLGLVPFQFQYYSGVADHYLYLSMLGPALAAAAVLARFPSRLTAVIAAIVVVVLAALSIRQAGFWHDELRLWEHNLAVRPDSALNHTSLGVVLNRNGQFEQAEYHLREALRLDPNDATAHNKLAVILAASGRLDEAIPHVADVLRLSQRMPPVFRPPLASTRHLFGNLLMSRHQYEDAIEQFRAALEENPNLESARTDLQAAEQMIKQQRDKRP
jgi:protein O-mannosyl-transferase